MSPLKGTPEEVPACAGLEKAQILLSIRMKLATRLRSFRPKPKTPVEPSTLISVTVRPSGWAFEVEDTASSPPARRRENRQWTNEVRPPQSTTCCPLLTQVEQLICDGRHTTRPPTAHSCGERALPSPHRRGRPAIPAETESSAKLAIRGSDGARQNPPPIAPRANGRGAQGRRRQRHALRFPRSAPLRCRRRSRQ